MNWDSIFNAISSTVFLNNMLLLAFYLIFGIAFALESKNPDSPVNWIHLIMDKGIVSLTKLGQFIGIASSTWVVVTMSQNKESFAIFPMVFTAWLAFLGGTWSFNQWIKSKQPSDK